MTSRLLDDRVVVVSGSTRGIGRAMVELFATEGARVVVNGRNAEEVAAVAGAIPAAVPFPGDLSDLPTITALVELLRSDFGRVDVLVNNAAISRRSALTRVTDEEWEEVIRINLTGPMYLTRAVVPLMKVQGRGVILNVISGAGTHGNAGFSSYGASKGGLVGLTMTWAQELTRFGIRTNALSPSALTDMMRQLPPELLDSMIERLASPEDVALVALSLVSDLGKLINGQIIGAGTPAGR